MRKVLTIAAMALLTAAPAYAGGETATGDQIKAAITGNTVQGAMVATGAYTEFYQADGTIKGNGYTGKWHIDGNTMCFAYGSDPADCLHVGLKGLEVEWIQGGKVTGTGTVVSGNPNNF